MGDLRPTSSKDMDRANTSRNELLKVSGLHVDFALAGNRTLRAVDGVDLTIASGEILGLVGESGCGKTVFSLSLLRLIDPPGRISAGEILWQGQDLMQKSDYEMRLVRGGQIAFIFQNPQSALNPVYSVGDQLVAVLRLHRGMTRNDARDEAFQLLRRVRMSDPERALKAYPHQLSGGMCQRVMIATALACKPKLLIADEPTTSLDVTIQAQIMDLLLEVREQFHMTILLVSHDLGVIAQTCDRVAVMYLGRIVEFGPVQKLYNSPMHPYTQALLGSVPVPDPSQRGRLTKLEGEISRAPTVCLTSGCRFRGRCPKAFDDCRDTDPALSAVDGEDHQAACLLYECKVPRGMEVCN